MSGKLCKVTVKISGKVLQIAPEDKDYLDTQGVAFDIYTKKDGYAFNRGTTSSTKNKFQLVHFTMNGTMITKKKYVKYAFKNVGHANDATIFRAKGNKYLLFAVSGGSGLFYPAVEAVGLEALSSTNAALYVLIAFKFFHFTYLFYNFFFMYITSLMGL